MIKLLVLFLALAFAANPAEAASKRKRVAKHPPAASAQTGLRHEGPRMIEIRPGYWISSWGCYTDEGYGRIGTCDGREGND